MKKKMCIFIAGTKGGVGKSFFAMQAASAALDLGLTLRVYDSDTENHTVQSFLGKKAIFLDDSNESYPLDAVINGLVLPDAADVTIVDMKAGTTRSTQEWFRSVPWEELDRTAFEIVIAGCFTSDPESIKTFIPWVKYFHSVDFPVHYLLVQNFKDGKNFDSFKQIHEIFQSLRLSFELVSFRAMDQTYITSLNLKQLPVRAVVKGEDTSILHTLMERSRVRRDYQSFTDPLIHFFSSYLDKSKITETQKTL